MGLLDRIAARTVDRGTEKRYSADTWISDYLVPSQFGFNGLQYSAPGLGLTQTLAGNRATEILTTLPGYLAALRACPPAFAAQLVRALVLSQARFVFRNPPWHPTSPRKTFGNRALGVLERPWPNGTTGELIARMEWHAGVAGNAFVVRRPGRLRVLRPDWTAVLYGSQLEPDDPGHALDGELLGYIYQNQGLFNGKHKPQTLLPQDVAHWSPLPDPENAGIGMSWITPAVREIQKDRLATTHTIRYFEQGATPNLVVKGVQAASREQFEEIVGMMEASHAGVANAYKTLYLTAGADATVVGSNLAEIDLKGVNGASETRIASLSRVHPVILGIAEGLAGSSLNAGNFGMARRIWADSWIYPTLQDLAASLAPLVDVPADTELWTDTGDMPILREDARDAAEIEQTKAATISSLITNGFTRKSVIAAVAGQNMTLLEEDPDWISVQLQAAAGATGPAGGVGPKVPPAVRSAERKFNPAEPREPHSGKWVGHGGGAGVKDALNLAGRIQLGNGEHFTGSAKVKDANGDLTAVLAGVDGPSGRRVRLGLVQADDARRWRAADKGGTVVLDQAGATKLHEAIARARERGGPSVAEYKAAVRDAHSKGLPESQWPDPEASIASGVIGAGWGDLHWSISREYGSGGINIDGTEYPAAKWVLGLSVDAPGGAPMDQFDLESPGALQKLDAALAGLMAPPDEGRAAGHDVTPGHDQLHHYWVAGPGLAKWRGSPKPFTTLVDLLAEHVKPPRPLETYKQWAAAWFHEVFGFWPGSDLNRVTHGTPPRGHKVGPG